MLMKVKETEILIPDEFDELIIKSIFKTIHKKAEKHEKALNRAINSLKFIERISDDKMINPDKDEEEFIKRQNHFYIALRFYRSVGL